jgi:hypothetical protein
MTKGELYRIDNFSGFAMDSISATDTDRDVALEIGERVWIAKVPAGTCATRGGYVKWSAGTGFKTAATDLADEASALVKTAATVAKVEAVRNSAGYAALRLEQNA